MGLPNLLVFFLFLFFDILSLPVAQGSTDSSAISFTLCEGFTGEVNFRISVKDKRENTVSTRFRETTRQKNVDGKIDQKNVKRVKITSDHEICFQALVVDVTIIIDQPTNFKASCQANNNQDDNSLPCKELGSNVKPVFICPQALTKLLKDRGVIENEPIETPGPNDFEPPTYDITNDMIQASSTIADGLTEGFGTIVKHRLQTLADARKVNINQISRRLGSFASFLSALGPAFNVFGGITSIVTTFLTPNPFDEMAKYLKKEFDEVHQRLSHLQDDIADLKRVLQAQGKLLAMADKLQAIRYSLRRYENMVESLSKDPVCGSSNLLKRSKVRDFMTQYKQDRVEDSLLDLYGVEFGEVLEASSLLKPFMRAYCDTDSAKVQRFMQEISNYAYAGSLAHFAYKNLQCRKRGRQNCDGDDEEREEWMMKLYKFLKKASTINEAAVDPVRGLHLDMKEDLDKLIYDEVKKAPNLETTEFPGLFDKVNDFIINKLYDINDWPEACIVKLKNDRVVITLVAELQANALSYGSDFKPWALAHTEPRIGLKAAKFKIQSAERGYTKKEIEEWWDMIDVFCGPILENESCSVRSWNNIVPSTAGSNDRIIYFLFNPKSYLIAADPVMSNVVTTTPTVVINMFPIDVYYASAEYMERRVKNADIVVGCWLFHKDDRYFSCRTPTMRDPNRPTWDQERYIAVIKE